LTMWPPSISTRKRVFASACVTTPSTSRASSFFGDTNSSYKRMNGTVGGAEIVLEKGSPSGGDFPPATKRQCWVEPFTRRSPAGGTRILSTPGPKHPSNRCRVLRLTGKPWRGEGALLMGFPGPIRVRHIDNIVTASLGSTVDFQRRKSQRLNHFGLSAYDGETAARWPPGVVISRTSAFRG